MTSHAAEGQMAPDFTLPGAGATSVTLSSLRPGRVVLFTYGGDGTLTCTHEVMDFNTLLPDFCRFGRDGSGIVQRFRRQTRQIHRQDGDQPAAFVR